MLHHLKLLCIVDSMSNFKRKIMKTRIHFLDNLRTFLIFLVIVLHAGLVYETVLENSWIVSDPDKSSTIGLIRMYLDIFVMFAIFFISGYFIPYSVSSKSTSKFLVSKFRRILLPWIISVFTLIPAYKAIFLYSRGLPQEAWFSYFHLFNREGGNPYFYADNPVQNWLWFLPVLFMFQVTYMIHVKTNILPMKISLKRGVVLTFIIGVVYSIIISSLNLKGWYHSGLLHFQNERLLIYFMMFLLGALCYRLKVFELKSSKKSYIISNIVLTFSMGIYTVVALNLFFNIIEPGRNYYFISEFFDRLLYYSSMLITMFSMLYVFIYSFKKSLNISNWLMEQLASNSYFVYIIHVIVMGLVALSIINISMPVYVKLLIVIVLTYLISNLVVYLYRVLFQSYLSKSIVLIPVLIAITILTISITVKQANQEKILVSNETEVNDLSTHTVGIHMAIIQGNMDAVMHHISNGTDIDMREAAGGSSPLILAAIFDRTEIAKKLIKAGADINLQNNDGSSPLHTAAFFCRIELVELLLKEGANKEVKNNSGATPLVSVSVPFENVLGIYNYFTNTLVPLGLSLDYKRIEETRPLIANILK